MPIDYERARAVIEQVRKTGALQPAVDAINMSRNTFISWIEIDSQLADEYARAKRQGIDALVEDTLRLADEPPPSTAQGNIDTGAVAHAKLRIETRRWFAERLEPRVYGLTTKQEVSGPNGGPVQTLIATGVPETTPSADDIC